ncbi:MAG TPA: helix-turn-helix domain-containing protein [Anaerolineales bacterium]|nr:helix-turn-helix domain-containing protein [Anaerolineales bacterium]
MDEWLSLSEAAKQLGVHPSTVRAWADHGYLPSQRTQGGHRRFRRSDVEMRMHTRWERSTPEANSVYTNVLRNTRVQISESNLELEKWYRKMDDDSREQYRLSGRSLVQGLVSHLSNSAGELDAEAKSLGYEYASRGQRVGLTSVEAAHAFQFFRTAVMDAILTAYENADVRSPQIWTELFRKINSFSDLIIITLLDTYEAFQHGTH